MWLECAVEDTDDKGRKTHTTEAKDSGRGIPQGSPLSPLLANLYMRRFVLGWKKLGLELVEKLRAICDATGPQSLIGECDLRQGSLRESPVKVIRVFFVTKAECAKLQLRALESSRSGTVSSSGASRWQSPLSAGASASCAST
jgi:hypothetical protein